MSDKKYIEKIGRRKTSTARVRVTPASKMSFTVNDIDAKEYFKTPALTKVIHDVMTLIPPAEKYEVSVHIMGGGIHSQAEAVRHGLARIFAGMNEEDRSKLKKEGFLKRDPRAKERRKFGLKKARKAPQWSKR
jgi:small subunit ribosomal protein S9